MFLASKKRLNTSMFLAVKDGGVYPVWMIALRFTLRLISPALMRYGAAAAVYICLTVPCIHDVKGFSGIMRMVQ